MPSSPWLRSARHLASARLAVLITIPSLALLSGCGSNDDATDAAVPSSMPPATTPCVVPASAVAQAIRSDVALLRTGQRLCVYGTQASPGRADQKAPIAKIHWSEASLAEERAEYERRRPRAVTAREDLAPGVFSMGQALKQGRYRETIVLPGGGSSAGAGSFTVSIDMPATPDAEDEATDRAEALFDLLS